MGILRIAFLFLVLTVTASGQATQTFSKIYQVNAWGHGSGLGSTVEYTKEYRIFLQNFLNTIGVKTVLDIGCGDWQSTKLIDWSKHQYIGVDCVESVINNNQKLYSKDNIQFKVHDIIGNGWDTPVDLIIIKDVLQHWPTTTINKVLPQLRNKAKYLLVINCANQPANVPDIPLGGMRHLSHKLSPLNTYRPKLLFTFHTKEVVLIEGELL